MSLTSAIFFPSDNCNCKDYQVRRSATLWGLALAGDISGIRLRSQGNYFICRGIAKEEGERGVDLVNPPSRKSKPRPIQSCCVEFTLNAS